MEPGLVPRARPGFFRLAISIKLPFMDLTAELLRYGGVGVLALVLFYFYREALKNLNLQQENFRLFVDKMIAQQAQTFKDGREEGKSDREGKHREMVDLFGRQELAIDYTSRKLQKVESYLAQIMEKDTGLTPGIPPKET